MLPCHRSRIDCWQPPNSETSASSCCPQRFELRSVVFMFATVTSGCKPQCLLFKQGTKTDFQRQSRPDAHRLSLGTLIKADSAATPQFLAIYQKHLDGESLDPDSEECEIFNRLYNQISLAIVKEKRFILGTLSMMGKKFGFLSQFHIAACLLDEASQVSAVCLGDESSPH